MPYFLQSKLLRVIQEKEITRLGGTKSIPIDTRIIASTNKMLENEISLGNFRRDLYYRLSVIPIEVPPLRDRNEDILLLINLFLKRFNTKYGTHKRLTLDAIHLLERYHWPGNVRELENLINRLIITTSENNISVDTIHMNLSNSINIEETMLKCDKDFDDIIGSIEKRMIKNALEQYSSTYKAADALGITQSRIFRKMKRYGLVNGQ
jgi:transcriptional regulator with PAS, ATPase and Fis domain